jgi:CheY-like chemotaxis protein
VLIVEDNIETQRLIEVYLKGTYRVSQASNAQSAFAALRANKPDIIIMDVNLPGQDGLAITREIRKGTICPKIPIVALTAFAMTGDRQRCIDAGCTDYLSKPATKREVLAMLAKCLQDTPQ